MKQLIVPIAIIVALIAFFVIIDRKDFNRHDDVQTVQSESPTNRKPLVSVSETTSDRMKPAVEAKPVAEAQPETDPESVTEAKPKTDTKQPVGETKPIAEAKHVAEAKLIPTVAEKKPKEKPLPAAIPVVTAKEAKMLNAQALVFVEKYEKKNYFLIKRGMRLIEEDKLTNYVKVSISEKYDDILKKNGVVMTRGEILNKDIPYQWTIDFTTLRGNCDIEKTPNGYEINSPDGYLRIQAPSRYIANTETGIQFDISSNTEDTHIKCGVEEMGLFRPGKTYLKEISGCHTEELVQCEISALQHYSQVRPFLEIRGNVIIHNVRTYQKELIGSTVVEGLISERSILPDPKQSDYPNCRFTIHFVGNAIKTGKTCPKEIVLIAEGFNEFKPLKTDALNKNEKMECAIVPYNSLSEEEQATQQADDLNLFALENYYILNARKVNAFSEREFIPTSGIYFSDGSKEYVSIFDRHINPPISNMLHSIQNRTIQDDLRKIADLLKEYNEPKINAINEAFQIRWKKEKEKDPPNYNRIGNNVWREVDGSFWCLPCDYTIIPLKKELSQSVINFFKDLKDSLESNGVQLIVSLVPNIYSISARVINEEFRDVPDFFTATVVKQLLENEIEAVYASDAILNDFHRFPFAYFLPTDGHPSDTTQDILAEQLAKRLERYELSSPDLQYEKFEIKQMPHVFGEDKEFLWPEKCDIGNMKPQTSYYCREIYYNGNQLKPNPDSPILVVGNSFIRTPMDKPCSFPTLISLKTGYSIDSYVAYNDGPFVQFPKLLLSNPERYLKNKRVLIFQVGVEHLFNRTQSLLNIRQMDESLSLICGRQSILIYTPIESTNLRPNINHELLDQLKNPSFFLIENDNDTVEVANIKLPNIDTKNPVVCVIPAVAFKPANKISLNVNGVSKDIPKGFNIPEYTPVSFLLPSGTSNISISATSIDPFCVLFALSNIQIFQ